MPDRIKLGDVLVDPRRVQGVQVMTLQDAVTVHLIVEGMSVWLVAGRFTGPGAAEKARALAGEIKATVEAHRG